MDFGRLLYELSAGEECPTNRCTNRSFLLSIPDNVIREIIYKNLCKPKGNTPTEHTRTIKWSVMITWWFEFRLIVFISEICLGFFQVDLMSDGSWTIIRLKLNSKNERSISIILVNLSHRNDLEWDRVKVSWSCEMDIFDYHGCWFRFEKCSTTVERYAEHLMSDEEKLKRRRERQVKTISLDMPIQPIPWLRFL